MGATSSWGTFQRAALSIAFAAMLASGGPIAGTARAAINPCALPDKLYDAGLLTEAAQRYHTLERAASGRAAASACVRAGLRRVERTRHERARQIRDTIADHNEAVRSRPARSPGPAIADATALRLRRAARLGREDQIAQLVAHGIARGDGRYGLAIARVLARAHYAGPAAAVVAATVAAHPAVRVPPRLRSLAEQRRRLAARRRRAARRLAARRQIAVAEAYSEAGLDSEAQAAVKRALALYPRVEVPYELRSPTGNLPFWNRVRGHYGPWLRTIVEMAIAALALVVIAFALFRLPRLLRARPVVHPFTGEPKEAGPATTTAVRENCAKLRGDGGHRLKIVESSGEAFQAIPREVGEVYAPAGVAVALLGVLGRLVPSRTRRITGQVRPRDPQRGAGLTITYGRTGKVFQETTLWERDYGTPPQIADRDPVNQPYDRVALPAAVWLTFVSANHALRRQLRAWLGRPRPFAPLGTADWHSFALFAVGAERHASGDDVGASRAYHRALGDDQRNRGAALNLAALDLLSASPEKRRTARDRLNGLREQLDDDTADEIWYRVRYCRTVGWLNMDLRPDPDEPAADPQPTQARKEAVELCLELLEQRPLRRWRDPAPLAWLLRRVGWFPRWLERRSGRRCPWRWHRKAEPVFVCSVLAAALMILAVALQQEAGHRDDEVEDLTFKSLRKALRAFHARPDEVAAFDALVTHRSLVSLVTAKLSLNADALYNHACYQARAAAEPPQEARRWADVEQTLHEAMRRGGPPTAWWATVDPTLEAFRGAPQRRIRLLEVKREVGG